jgi:hypothetical protein
LTLATNATTPTPVGTSIQMSASGRCYDDGASPEYRFSARAAGAKSYTVIRDWGPLASALWDTTGLVANSYSARVEIRESGAVGPAQAYKNVGIVLGGLCQSVALGISPSGPPDTDSLSLLANASCAVGVPEYRFSYDPPGPEADIVFRDWGGPDASFGTGGLFGVYDFTVEARAAGTAAPAQSAARQSHDMGGGCTLSEFGISPAPPPSTVLNLMANGSCADGAQAEYAFRYRVAGVSSWTSIRDWGATSTSWDPAYYQPRTTSYKPRFAASDIQAQSRQSSARASAPRVTSS